MPSTTGRRSVIPLEATPDRLRYASEIDSEGPRVAPRHQCDSLERCARPPPNRPSKVAKPAH
jgi:hypothetical protein